MIETDEIAKKVMAVVFSENTPNHSGYFLTHPVPTVDQELEGMLVMVPQLFTQVTFLITLTLGEQIPPKTGRLYQQILRATVPEAVETAEVLKYGENPFTEKDEISQAKERAFDLAEPLISAVFYREEGSETRLIQLICLLPLRTSTALSYMQREIRRGLANRRPS